MKSTDEIKKAMLHCSPVSCRSNDCPYKDDTPKYEGDMPVCRTKLWHDMVCLIQQLQAENAALLFQCEQYVKCVICKYADKGTNESPCCDCLNCNGDATGSHWQWRGVQKEDSDDGKE